METPYQITAAVILLSTVSISVFFRSKAAAGRKKAVSSREEGGWILTLRSLFGLAGWLSAFLYLINPRWMAWAQLDLPAWLRWSGAGLMLVCLPLIFSVFYNLSSNVTPTVAITENHTLVTRGPYRWVRHPLYTVAFASFIGFSLLSANWFTLLMLLLGFIIIVIRTPIEEQRLIDRFGEEYILYMNRTGRFLPRF
jgi:protein-S-isoprenylcysteine O-methyltransferase Ste14